MYLLCIYNNKDWQKPYDISRSVFFLPNITNSYLFIIQLFSVYEQIFLYTKHPIKHHFLKIRKYAVKKNEAFLFILGLK